MSLTRTSSIPNVYQYKTAREFLKAKFEYAALGDLKRRANLQLMSLDPLDWSKKLLNTLRSWRFRARYARQVMCVKPRMEHTFDTKPIVVSLLVA